MIIAREHDELQSNTIEKYYWLCYNIVLSHKKKHIILLLEMVRVRTVCFSLHLLLK